MLSSKIIFLFFKIFSGKAVLLLIPLLLSWSTPTSLGANPGRKVTPRSGVGLIYQKTFNISEIKVTLDTVSNSSYSAVRWRLSKNKKVLGPEQKRVTIFGGPYFEPGRKQQVIDLVIKDGYLLKAYRWDWGRPVLVFWSGGAAIIPGKKRISHFGRLSTLKRGPTPGRSKARKPVPAKAPEKVLPSDFQAFAADSRPTNGGIVTGRQIVSLRKVFSGKSLTIIRMWATEKATRRWLHKQGHTNYVFLDGGSSSPPSAPIPVHMVITQLPAFCPKKTLKVDSLPK